MMLTCLIGEADPFITRLLNRFAEESRLQAFLAARGEDLVKLARECRPNVIILDVELPGQLRGWEAVRELRSDPLTVGIPVVSCSWASGAVVQELIGEACAHLQKPELYYSDFQAVLKQVGIELGNQPEGPGTHQSNKLISHD